MNTCAVIAVGDLKRSGTGIQFLKGKLKKFLFLPVFVHEGVLTAFIGRVLNLLIKLLY